MKYRRIFYRRALLKNRTVDNYSFKNINLTPGAGGTAESPLPRRASAWPVEVVHNGLKLRSIWKIAF